MGCLLSGLAQAAPNLTIVSSERSPAYQEAADAMLVELERAGLPRTDVLQLTAQEFSAPTVAGSKLIVALGAEAAGTVARLESRIPVLCALLPRSSFERVLIDTGRKPSSLLSALYLDQPLARQLALIRVALPETRRIGVLWGPESQLKAAELTGLLRSAGLELVDATVARNEAIFPGLKKVLESADVLLALADPQIFNSSSIQNILLSSFKARIPLVAFSPSYVRAGALMALHATPAQVGTQAAGISLPVLQGKGPLAAPLYTRDFSVTVNEHVARSLRLTLDAQSMRERLRQSEAAP
jgi:ABC-type uncharacterized transport system substrate-binding protein